MHHQGRGGVYAMKEMEICEFLPVVVKARSISYEVGTLKTDIIAAHILIHTVES